MDQETESSRGNGDWAEQAKTGFSQAASALGDVDEQLRTFVRERPFAAVAAAVATGYVLGRLLSRR